MPLARLDNFLKNVRGNILYVSPNDLDSTDSIENQGNSMARPFKTIQRALVEAARFSYQKGLDNDRFGKTTVLLYPGDHVIDNRPGLIKQTRVGLHGKNFHMYKFRTMKINSHDERIELDKLNQQNGPLFKIDNDPRIIKGAKSLRKFSLDELPQLLNVLKGQMSLVGPRPLFPEDNAYFDENYIRRLNVLPGITGLLQINERNTSDFEIWYKYDIEYIENWSILLDLKILFKTPISLMRTKIIGK